MNVIIWEQEAGSLLQGSYETKLVNSKEEFLSCLSEGHGNAMVLIVDVDQVKDEIFDLDEKINDIAAASGKDFRKIFTSESYGPDEFRKIQKKGLVADAFLKRPHDQDSLTELVEEILSEFELEDGNAGDIKLDVTSSFSEEQGDSSEESMEIENTGSLSLDMNNENDGAGLDLDSTTATAFAEDLGAELPDSLTLGDGLEEETVDQGALEFDSISLGEEQTEFTELENEKEEFNAQDEEDEGEVQIHTSAVINPQEILESELGEEVLEEKDSSGTEEIENDPVELTQQTGSILEEEDDEEGDKTALTELYTPSERFKELNQETISQLESENNLPPEEIDSKEEDLSLSKLDADADEDVSDSNFALDEGSGEKESPIHFRMGDEIRDTIQKARESEEATRIMGTRELQHKIAEGLPAEKELGAPERENVYEQIYKEEILRLKSTIENLREDREELVEKNRQANEIISEFKFRVTGIQAELDEVKIELGFMKKKYEKEREDYVQTRDHALEKRDLLLEKNKELKKEIEVQGQRIRIDVQKSKEREKMLEGQLELLKADSESLIKSRDKKILELKRSIDSLEFDLETLSESERKSRLERVNLEEKLSRIMSTLRRTIGSLDEEIDSEKVQDQDKRLTEI